MRVLKLDAAFQPVEIIPWTEAFRLIFLEKATVIEEYEDLQVRSVSEVFAVPSVIKVNVVAPQKRHVKFCRENVFARDDYRCQYCGRIGEQKDLTLDHLVPASRGGRREWTNIVTACQTCNARKADKTIKQANMRLCSHPHRPKWSPRKTIKIKDVDPESWQNYMF